MELPTGTVTFLFTDIEGSTRLLDELGEGYAAVLAEHHRLMRDAFEPRGGVEVDTAGDAFFVVFERASDCVAAAAAAQAALAPIGLRVRMGIHTGQPLLTGTGYVGMDVHQAARVMSAGHGGQVLVSDATRAFLDGGPGLTDLGLHRLKDLTEPQRLWQLGEIEFPPLKTLYQTNLPVQPTALIGREAELAEVVELLEESRLVTLTGAGGSGKTRLALQAAAELTDEFKDGVWWVSLASLRDPDLVEPTIGQVVGAKESLAEHIHAKRMLLLLDNFEQLLEAAPLISELLAEAPDLRVLATSRERLGLAGEHEYAVPTMVPVEAAALFTARARQLEKGFEPDDATDEICRRLDGLPLAIELAAARIKVLRPDQILERLGRSLDLLTSGPRDAPERHQTLRATIEWSYELLTDNERRLFTQLAVFAGSFDLEAAEKVCGASLDTLGGLVEKSLLRRTEEGRFFLLQTVLGYSAELLESSIQRDELLARHAQHYLTIAESTPASMNAETITRLDQDHANFRSALAFFRKCNQIEDEVSLIAALATFWDICGHAEEACGHARSVVSRSEHLSTQLRARAFLTLARFESRLGAVAAAKHDAEKSVALFRTTNDAGGLAHSLLLLGLILGEERDVSEAERCTAEAAELWQALGDRRLAGGALINMGLYALLSGHYDRAEEQLRYAVEALEAEGEMVGSLIARQNLAVVHHWRGDLDAARKLAGATLREAEELGHIEGVYVALGVLAGVAADEGRLRRAARLLGASEEVQRREGTSLEVVDQMVRDRTIQVLSARLASTELDHLRLEGQELTRRAAVDYAVPT